MLNSNFLSVQRVHLTLHKHANKQMYCFKYVIQLFKQLYKVAAYILCLKQEVEYF